MSKNKTILGIDPSSKSGFALVKDGEVVHQGTYKVTDKEVDWHIRGRLAANFFEDLIDRHEVDVVAIEGYAMNAKFNIIQMVTLGCLIREMLISKKIHWFEIAPTKAKQLTTHKGKATKKEMMLHVERLYGIKPKNNDIADAIAIAMIAHKAYNLETISMEVGFDFPPERFVLPK
ncbi:MAG: crossover junction endodeoxyribonuclease RuvC [Bacteroidaceae bacterium]